MHAEINHKMDTQVYLHVICMFKETYRDSKPNSSANLFTWSLEKKKKKNRCHIKIPPSINTVGCEPVPVMTSCVRMLVFVSGCLSYQKTNTASTQ